MAEKNQNFPNAFEAFLLVAGLFMAEYLVGAALYDMHGFLSIETRDLAGIITLLGNGCVFTLVMHYKGLSYGELFHPSASSALATFFVLFPAILLTVPALLLVSSVLGELLVWLVPMSSSEVAMFAEMESGGFAAIVCACILAPILEEMLFRGIILRSFLQLYSRSVAIFGSAFLFGIAHLNIYQFAAGAVMGVFLGWLYERTRSIIPCIALHAAYNIGCTWITLNGAGDPSDSPDGFSAFAWASAILLGVAGVFMLRRILLVRIQRQPGS
ncbi:MAG: type II CAAX endopeptidase family protein [Pseudomonadota bacterium]